MFFNSLIEETMDEEMQPYLNTESYKSRHELINAEYNKFRDSLTSKARQEQFLRLMDMLSEEHADFSVNAYITGFKAGMKFTDQAMER